jgi:hypothetical protein
MDPLTIFGLATGGLKTIAGLFQKNKAKKLKESNYIPPALKEAETEAKILSNASTAPGQQAEEEAIKQGTSQYLSNVSKTGASANEMQNFAGAAIGNENKLKRDIARRTLLWKDQQRSNRNAIRGRIGQQQSENRRQFQAAKSALTGAGNQNLFSGLSDIGGSLAFGLSKNKSPYNSDYGTIQ